MSVFPLHHHPHLHPPIFRTLWIPVGITGLLETTQCRAKAGTPWRGGQSVAGTRQDKQLMVGSQLVAYDNHLSIEQSKIKKKLHKNSITVVMNIISNHRAKEKTYQDSFFSVDGWSFYIEVNGVWLVCFTCQLVLSWWTDLAHFFTLTSSENCSKQMHDI